MSETHLGWVATTLGAVCEKISDGSHNPPKAADSGRPMLSAKNIRSRTVYFDDYRLIDDESFTIEDARTRIQSGDVLLTIVGAIGRSAAVLDEYPPFVLQRSVAVLRSTKVLPRFLAYALESPSTQKYLDDNAKGTAQKGIYLGALAKVPLLVPPANEQTRIADKLDTVLTRVDACRDRLARVAPLLKRFRQSVLAAATSGRLTEDWRSSSKLNWRHVRADEVCAKVQSGGTPKSGFSSEGTPFLKVYNIVDQMVDFDYRPQYVTKNIHQSELKKSISIPGDVVMNIVGPPLGKVAIVPDSYPEWNLNQAVTLFRPADEVLSKWIYIVLYEGQQIRDVLKETKGSVGQINISLSQCRAFIFPIPAVEEQTEIVRRVETLFAFANRLETRLKAAHTAADRLTPALLAKAFRGELVPQDPNDEPAAELLKRLAASRDAAPKAKRGRRSATADTTP